jgi:hypothetical protein
VQTKRYEVLDTFDMTNVKPTRNACVSNSLSDPAIVATDRALNADEHHLYRRIVGCLMYLSNTTRADICFATNQLARFCAAPFNQHMKAARNLLRYCKGTIDYKLKFNCPGTDAPDFTLSGYSDSDWGGDQITRCSTSGYLIYLNGNLVHWSSQRQKSVALSSTESEYVALNLLTNEIVWFQLLMNNIFGVHLVSNLLTDNEAAQYWCNNPAVEHKKAKHIDIRYKYVKQKVLDGVVTIGHIGTADMLADILTKQLSTVVFTGLRDRILSMDT